MYVCCRKCPSSEEGEGESEAWIGAREGRKLITLVDKSILVRLP
jgi:hypothetical protein